MRRSRISNRAISKRAGPACAAGAPTWWNNVQGLSPCDVYQAILDKCGYVAPALIGDEAYYPVSQAETCMCNTITYNLGSACQDCQRGTTDQGMAFSAYLAGGDFCETQSTNLPDLAVPTEDIPLWAYLDTSTQFWTYGSAQEIALNSTTTIPSTTSTPVSSNAPMDPTPILTLSDPNSSPTDTPAPSTSKSTNAGAIGGGVAGGVVAILAVIGLLLFLRRRRARGSHDGPDTPMATAGGPGRNGSVSSESSLTESGKVAGSTSHSHYTPHSQMAQLNHNGSGVHIPMHSTSSALTTPIDAPPVPTLPHEYTPSTPARSLAASPTPSAPAVQKVKRVPVRYSEDELAQAEEEAKRAAQHQP